MRPHQKECAGGLDRHGEADYGTTEQRHPTAIRQSGLVNISVAVRHARNWLARLIATPDEVFSSDMSLIVDRLTAENEQLRGKR